MNVLITGAAGYVGSHTAKHCMEAGFTVKGVDNFSTGSRRRVLWGECEEGDAGDVGVMRALLRRAEVSVVIHTAGSTQVGESLLDPGKYFENNVSATSRLLEAMEAEGVRNLVLSSSCSVYGSIATGVAREDSATAPMSPYGESKLMMERLAHWHGKAHGTRWLALRYFNVAGVAPGTDLGEDPGLTIRLIPKTINAALEIDGPFELYGTAHDTVDGTAVRDFVHVGDVARANLAAARYLVENPNGVGMALNIGSGHGYSIRDVLAAAGRATGQNVPLVYRGGRPGDPGRIVSDPSRAAEVLGWSARQSSLDELIRSTLDWYSLAGFGKKERYVHQ